jgi:hypothetical protein
MSCAWFLPTDCPARSPVAGALELGIRKFWSLEEKQRAFASAAGLEVSPKAIS